MERFYNNRVLMAQSPIAPTLAEFDPNFKNPWKEFDLEKAKAHLKKAGYPDGKGLPPLEYSMSGSSTIRQFGEFFAEQMGKIGIKVNLVSHSWPQFQERIRQKKAQIFGIAWAGDYPDAQNFFQLLYGPHISPGSNQANYQSKEFDALYDKAMKLPPGPARSKLYLEMRDVFVRDMSWIPTVHRLGYQVYHGWLHNLKKDGIIHGFYKYLRVDLDKKKEFKAKL